MKTVAITVLTVAVTVSFVTRIATADDTYNTVLGLLAQCRSVEKEASSDLNAANWGLCHGRIEGYFVATGSWARPKPFCAPPDITRKKLVRIFIRWAESNPGKWIEPSYVGLQSALTDAFPCEKSQQS